MVLASVCYGYRTESDIALMVKLSDRENPSDYRTECEVATVVKLSEESPKYALLALCLFIFTEYHHVRTFGFRRLKDYCHFPWILVPKVGIAWNTLG